MNAWDLVGLGLIALCLLTFALSILAMAHKL
jgi:hypothetical protein